MMSTDFTGPGDSPSHLRLVYSRRDRERHLSILLPGRLHHELKAYCLKNDMSLRQLVTHLLREFIKTV